MYNNVRATTKINDKAYSVNHVEKYKTFQQNINKYTWYTHDTETKEPVPTTWHEETKTT